MEKIERHSKGIYFSREGAGTNILMIHGIISDSSFFDPLVECMQNEWDIIKYDRRAYGKSNQEKWEDYSIKAQAEDAVSILKECDIADTWILGDSAGGLVALEIAQNYPEYVKGLILLESPLGYTELDRQNLSGWNDELLEILESGKIERAMVSFVEQIGDSNGKENGKAAKKVSLLEMRQMYLNLSAFMYGELQEVHNYLPLPQRLHALEIPVYMIISESGKNSIFAKAAMSAANMFNWPIIWANGFHNVAKEQPQEVERIINAIVKEK